MNNMVFTLDSRQSFGQIASRSMYGEAVIISLQAGKHAHTLFNYMYIFITDGSKINKKNKSIGKGPLYLQTEFEAI